MKSKPQDDGIDLIKRINSELITIYCADGPYAKSTHSVRLVHRKAYLPLPRDRFYKQAVYFVSTGRTGFGEFIAVFSHAVKR